MKYTEAYVRYKLATSRNWVQRAIEVLDDFQTAFEKQVRQTVFRNQFGFNRGDAKILMSYALVVRNGHDLNPYDLADACKRLPRYTQQIMRLIEARGPQVT